MVVASGGYESVQGRRTTMEDTHVLMEDVNEQFNINDKITRAYYAVYDGHGGKNAAEMTAELLHRNIISDPEFVNGHIEQALLSGYDKTDKTILQRASQEKWSNGTTTVVCVLIGTSLYIANTGDSEAVIASSSPSSSSPSSTSSSSSDTPSSILLTEKHKPTTAAEKKRIEEAGGQVVFGRVLGSLAVSKALGDLDFKHPYNKGQGDFVSALPFIQKYDLTPANQFMVIACDGLWDKLSYEDAIEFIARAKDSGKDPTETSQLLVKHALDLGSFDNITAIVVYFNWDKS